MDEYRFLIFFGVMMVLQLWVFPKLGLPSCFSPRGCAVPPRRPTRTPDDVAAPDGAPDERPGPA